MPKLLVTSLILSLLVLGCTRATPTPTATATLALTATPTATLVPTPTLTPTPLPTATFTPTPTPLPTATFTPTATPTITPTPSPTPTPTVTPTPTPSPTPTPVPPTPTPTPVPTWPVSSTSGAWSIETDETDPLTDLRKVVVALSSEEVYDYWLLIRCNVDDRRRNLPEVLVLWNNEIEDEDPEILLRFDEEEAERTVWGTSTSGTATFYQGYQQGFIWNLMNAEKLAMRLHATGILTATFTLEGLATVLSPYKDTCDWVGF